MLYWVSEYKYSDSTLKYPGGYFKLAIDIHYFSEEFGYSKNKKGPYYKYAHPIAVPFNPEIPKFLRRNRFCQILKSIFQD